MAGSVLGGFLAVSRAVISHRQGKGCPSLYIVFSVLMFVWFLCACVLPSSSPALLCASQHCCAECAVGFVCSHDTFCLCFVTPVCF